MSKSITVKTSELRPGDYLHYMGEVVSNCEVAGGRFTFTCRSDGGLLVTEKNRLASTIWSLKHRGAEVAGFRKTGHKLLAVTDIKVGDPIDNVSMTKTYTEAEIKRVVEICHLPGDKIKIVRALPDGTDRYKYNGSSSSLYIDVLEPVAPEVPALDEASIRKDEREKVLALVGTQLDGYIAENEDGRRTAISRQRWDNAIAADARIFAYGFAKSNLRYLPKG